MTGSDHYPEGARVRVGDKLGTVHREVRTIVVRSDSGELGYFVPSFVQLLDQPSDAPADRVQRAGLAREVARCAEQAAHGGPCDEPVKNGLCAEHGAVDRTLPRAPRVWHDGTEEPSDRRLTLRDVNGFEWSRVAEGWMLTSEAPGGTHVGPYPWRTLTHFSGPLIELVEIDQ